MSPPGSDRTGRRGASGASPATVLGRHAELARIGAARDDHALGEHLVLVAGDAGIGKTTLLRAAAAQARDAGWRVASGRCWDQAGAPAFWPWVQVLRALLVARPPAAVAPVSRAWVAELDPSLRALLGSPAPAPRLPPGRARFALLDAAASVLADQCAETGLLVVLDDLHAADASSLELARFVARSLSGAAFLLLAASRPPGPGTPGEVRRLLGELEGDAVRIRLTGLAPDDLAGLVRAHAGEEPDAADVRELHRATGGNPFFVGQLLRTGSGRAAMPPSIREVLIETLAPLSPATRAVLDAAAVFGVEFDPELLPEMSAQSAATVREAITDAEDAGVAHVVPDASGLCAFTHGLFQRVLLESLAPARRALIHQRIATTLEQGARTDLRWAAMLAAHCRLAVEALGVERMAAACLAAAEAATRVLAPEVATDELTAGLALLPVAAVAERAALMLALGRAQAMLGQVEASRATYLGAADAARGCGRGDLLAACALAMPPATHSLPLDAGVRLLVEEALSHVGDDHPHLKAPLLARLATELPFESAALRRETADRAMVLARTVGRRTEAEVLRWRTRSQENWDADAGRLADAEEFVRVSVATGDVPMELDAWLAMFSAVLSTGDVARAASALSEFDRRCSDSNAAHLQGASLLRHSALAALHGRFEEALRLAAAAREGNVRARDPDAVRSWSSQVFSAWNLLGRQTSADEIRSLSAELPVPRWVAGKFMYDGGLIEQARLELRRGLAELTGGRIRLWVSALAAGAELANRFGDADVAAAVLPYLEAAGHGFGVTADGALCLGSNELWVGHATAALGRLDHAAARFRAAVTANEAAGAAPFVARAQLELARVLLRRAGPGDVDEARTLLLSTQRLATELEMSWTADDAAMLRGSIPGPPSAQPWRLRRDGDLWTLHARGRAVHLRPSKGLEYLAQLIAAPGQEIAALDLASGASGAASSGGTSAVLDDDARRAYRGRLDALQDRADAADARGDAATGTRIEAERAALLAELRRASGLGGRPRVFGDEAERARVNVTRTIRQAVERVSEADADLGAQLSREIRTGHRCVYRPEAGARR